MIEITCQDCHSDLIVADDLVERGLLDGSIIEGEYVTQQRVGHGADDTRDVYKRAFLYVCKKCQAKTGVVKAKGEARPSRPRLTVEQESAEIQKIMGVLRTVHSDWTLEMAAHEAVEKFNDVSKIANADFRHYLMER